MEKENIYLRIYNDSTGEEIARIRVKFENYKKAFLWSTIQLEGLVLGKWLPLIRYDFAPGEKPSVHINKEYTSIAYKEEFNCNPQLLIKQALKKLTSLTESQILDFIEKRRQVFLREGK